MDWVTASIILFGVLLLLMALGIPVAFAMGLVGFFGYWVVEGASKALNLLPLTAYETVTSYNLSPIPLFMLMGEVLYYAGIGSELFDTAEKWLSRLPGGLAMAAVSGCALFAAICGSTVATAITIGVIAIPEMQKRGYSTRFAAGTVAAAGGLGLLIPPSVGLIILAVLTEQSAGRLLIAGFIPGITLACLYMIYIFIRVKLKPSLAPRVTTHISWNVKLSSLRALWPVVVLFSLVMGGIYAGFFTATEAAAIGAAGSILVAAGMRRLTWSKLLHAFADTMKSSAMLLTIMVFAMVYARLMAVTHIPQNLAAAVQGWAVPPYATLGMIVLVLLILGCFMEGVAMIYLTIPVLYPVAMALGFNPIWFLIIYQEASEIGTETPPVGMNLYAIHSVLPHIPMKEIMWGALPYVLVELTAIALWVIFPQLVLFLPNTMK